MRRAARASRPAALPVVLTDEAAALFQPHPIEGWYSLMKNRAGQYVTRETGQNLVFDATAASRSGSELVIPQAQHGQQGLARSLWSHSRLWGRRTLIDWGIPAASGTALVGTGAFTDYPTGRGLMPWEEPPLLQWLMAGGLPAEGRAGPGGPAASAVPAVILVVPTDMLTGEAGPGAAGPGNGAGGGGSNE